MSAEATWDTALGWLRDGALGQDPTVKAAIEGDRAAFDYKARAVREALRSEVGQVLREVLLDLTVRRPPVDHRLPSDTEYLRYAQLRMGQNQVLTGILAYYDHAEQLEKKPHAPAPVSDPAPDLLAGGRTDGRPSAGGPEPDPDAWLSYLGDAAGDAAVTG